MGRRCIDMSRFDGSTDSVARDLVGDTRHGLDPTTSGSHGEYLQKDPAHPDEVQPTRSVKGKVQQTDVASREY